MQNNPAIKLKMQTELRLLASERDTIRGVQIRAGAVCIYVYVIARVGVKFGINFTSVRLSGNKIARGEAECYLRLGFTLGPIFNAARSRITYRHDP